MQQQQLRWRCAAFCPPQITSLSCFHHKRAGIHLSPSLSFSPFRSLACTCFVSVCFLFARQSACRKLPTCQVASSASQLDAASFIHSLTVSAFPLSVRPSISVSVRLSARLLWPGWLRFVYFYPKNYLADDDDDDFLLQFCICVSRELGIQFLFITHSAAKLFLNCPYQLRNEIYYLACVYRQFASHTRHHQAPSLPRDFDNDDDDDGRQLRQADNVLNFCCRIIISLVGSSSSSLPSHSMPSKRIPCHSIASSTTAHPLSSSTSLVLCAAPTTFCIFT